MSWQIGELSLEQKAFNKAQNNFWAADLNYHTKGVEPFLIKLGKFFDAQITKPNAQLAGLKKNFDLSLKQLNSIRKEMDQAGVTPEFICSFGETPFHEEKYGRMIDLYKKTISQAVDIQLFILESVAPHLMKKDDYLQAQREYDADTEPLLKDYATAQNELQQAKINLRKAK